MRTVKSLRLPALLAVLLLALMPLMRAEFVTAQLPPSNPAVAPLPPPAAPALLPAPGVSEAAPSLVAVPSIPASLPTPGPSVFNCSCSGPGQGTRWMGQISAIGFFAARQAATSACISYNEQKEPPPAVVTTNQATEFGPSATLPQGFQPPDAAAAVPSSLPGELVVSSASLAQSCASCVCD